jgi:hypothetical protein
MGNSWSIQLRALLLLVAFAANFTVFCHCATAQKRHCCCEKQTKTKPCNSAQAVQFKLAEKQVADVVQVAPLPVIVLQVRFAVTEPAKLHRQAMVVPDRYPPPDILTLQQRFLI